jgi:hypothetical protein
LAIRFLDVRKYAIEHGLSEGEALQKGSKQKAKEFAQTGEVYQKV